MFHTQLNNNAPHKYHNHHYTISSSNTNHTLYKNTQHTKNSILNSNILSRCPKYTSKSSIHHSHKHLHRCTHIFPHPQYNSISSHTKLHINISTEQSPQQSQQQSHTNLPLRHSHTPYSKIQKTQITHNNKRPIYSPSSLTITDRHIPLHN